MKTEKEIKEQIRKLKGGDPHKAKPAKKAPIALTQLDVEAKIAALEWVLSKNEHHRNPR